jgi:hypothetical protein
MSFNLAAAGTKYQVLDSLRALTHAQLGTDGMGGDMRTFLVDSIEDGTDPGDNGQRYVVNASGHSNPGSSPVTLAVSVTVVNADPPAQEVSAQQVPMTDAGTGTDTLETQPA